MRTAVAGTYVYFDRRFRANVPGFFREFWPYILFASIAVFLDFLSTWHFMAPGNIGDELHPVIRSISYVFGPFFGPLIGKLGQVACLLWFTITYRPFARITFIPVSVIYLYAAWFNVWGIDLYTPMFYRLL